MVATGVFLATARDVVVTVRNSTVFVLPTSSSSRKSLRFEVLQGADAASEPLADADADASEGKKATPPAPAANRITAVELFHPTNSKTMALLLLVDERRLVYYELDVDAETLELRASRAVPRSATCMAVASVALSAGERRHVVVIGQKTGEAVAVPFPDVARDLKTLLGHTTSMITSIAVNEASTLLLTADRDEKLRVSRFPTASIIESYCLGHTASLTKLACSVVTPELVVSTSMDNTLKLWEMMSGTLLASQALLQGVQVAVEPTDETGTEASNTAKSLLNVSLAVCPKTNVVAVLVNYQHVRFFSIAASETGSSTLQELVFPTLETQTLLTNEPCELLFTQDGQLAVSYKKSPFLQLFTLETTVSKHLQPSERMNASSAAFQDFRSAAATIDLVDGEAKALDELEDGLKKKKARTGEWKKKLPDTTAK